MSRKLKDKWVEEATELRVENLRLAEENVKLNVEKDKLATMATTSRAYADKAWRRCWKLAILFCVLLVCLAVELIARFM